MKQLLSTFLLLSIGCGAFAQGQENLDVQRIRFYHPTLGYNGDQTYLYRADEINDRTKLRMMLGNEYTGSFEIGYTYYHDRLWYTAFSVNNSGDGFFKRNLQVDGKIGIGTTNPIANLEVSSNNLSAVNPMLAVNHTAVGGTANDNDLRNSRPFVMPMLILILPFIPTVPLVFLQEMLVVG